MSDDNRELQENAFARLAGAMVAGAGISKLMKSLKDKKKAKDAMQKFQDTLDRNPHLPFAAVVAACALGERGASPRSELSVAMPMALARFMALSQYFSNYCTTQRADLMASFGFHAYFAYSCPAPPPSRAQHA